MHLAIRLPTNLAFAVSAIDTIHLVVENLSTRIRKALVDRFGEEAAGRLWQRFTVREMPIASSWEAQGHPRTVLLQKPIIFLTVNRQRAYHNFGLELQPHIPLITETSDLSIQP